MKRRPIVYVAGKYSAPNIIEVLQNIREGNKKATEFLKKGFAPFSPFLDYQFSFFQDITVEEYYEYSMAFLERSDCVFVLPNSEESKGTQKEIERANELDIPIFFDEGELEKYKAEWELEYAIY